MEEAAGEDHGPGFDEGDFPAHFVAGDAARIGPAQERVVLRG